MCHYTCATCRADMNQHEAETHECPPSPAYNPIRVAVRAALLDLRDQLDNLAYDGDAPGISVAQTEIDMALDLKYPEATQ